MDVITKGVRLSLEQRQAAAREVIAAIQKAMPEGATLNDVLYLLASLPVSFVCSQFKQREQVVILSSFLELVADIAGYAVEAQGDAAADPSATVQ